MGIYETFEFTEEEFLEKLGIDPTQHSWAQTARVWASGTSNKRGLESPYMEIKVVKRN